LFSNVFIIIIIPLYPMASLISITQILVIFTDIVQIVSSH